MRTTAISGTVSRWLLLGLLIVGLSAMAFAQSEPTPPPPPPGGPGIMMMQEGPGMGMFLHHDEIGEGHQVVTGAPMTAVVELVRDQSLPDGNSIHTSNQSTVYRDSQGRVRREVPFEFVTPSTGATKGTMVVIIDPVAGYRYVLNPQNKTARQMPIHPPKGAEGQPPRPPQENVTTESLGSKTILGMQATGTSMTHTIPAGQIGNTKAITVVTDRWMSTDLQIPLIISHTDPMMGTMTMTVTSVTKGEPDASLFQVPSDYKIEAGKPGEPMMMPGHP